MNSDENERKIDEKALAERGERAARALSAAGCVSGRGEARRIKGLVSALAGARRGARGEAGEWLCDNMYLIEREGLAAAADFAAAKRVPAGRAHSLVCEAARELCAAVDGRVTPEAAGAFLDGFLRVRALSLTELGLLAAALRAGLTELLAELYSGEAPDAAEAAAAINSLRRLATEDLSGLVRRADAAGAVLGRDPAGSYPLMDERTTALYRARLAKIAAREGLSEPECARRVLELAEAHANDAKRGHVGWWLLCEPLGRPGRRRTGLGWAAALALLTALISAALGLVSGGVWTALLSLLPVSALVKGALDAALLRALPPRLPPRMELAEGVPREGRTLCVVSAVLARPEDGPALAARLEEFRLASRDCGGELRFGLLCDLPEAASARLPGDDELIGAAREAVEGLNAKYGGGFYLLLRPRREAARDRVWRGYERKRGALLELARLCSGRENELEVLSGGAPWLGGVKYILTLDADTRLLPGSARELIGAMLHPLNRAELDRELRRVSSGRGVIHPRIGVELEASERTLFSRTAAGPGGVDPYVSAGGEVWMDLTGCGGFAGKGILDVRALLECCSDLPENLVLSHDAVEGALLHGGYMSDCLLTDGFPAASAAFFKRSHRWTRGDWQNLAVLFRLRRRLRTADKLRLIDSARHSLVSPAAFAAVTLALLFPGAGLAPAGIAAALSLCPGLARDVARALTRRSGRERHPGSALYGAALGAGRFVLRLLLLPCAAWTALSAACTALWRALVSKRRLLQWQTSAQQAASGPAGALLAHWPAAAAGAALLIFSPEPAGKALGIVWLLAPLFALSLDRERPRERALGARSREFLLRECAKMWAYFDENCTAARGYLPPDNVQEQPPVGAAERTSPTNIGLALISCLAAADLALARPERAAELAEGMLETCERLEKWRGQLYNWYDLRTLRPLSPRYVSTVDSGNLAASLTALAAGLREYGRGDLAARAIKLRDGMDFSALYDEKRRLFRIGFDAGKGGLSEGSYDLLASEARLTGFYAVAHGDVPARHWRQLSRALVGRDGLRGLASWTGTMFEYLMPELFLPLRRGSLLWESARFCLYVQRRDAPSGGPWGQSESGFFALDAALAYRYKAHGCAALALRRGMDEDRVFAPYAAYLALAVAPDAAVRGLRRFAQIDPGGRYGLWEAVDFTPGRCAGGRGEVVRSVMAHHLGMSLAAAANALLGGVMQRRFMADPAMAAFAPLLAERAPEGAVLLRRRLARAHERAARPEFGVASAEGEYGAGDARVFTLSNGVYGVQCTDSGLFRSSAGGVSVYRGFESPAGPAGLRFEFLDGEGRAAELRPLPASEGGLRFKYRLRGGLLRFDGSRADGFACSLTTGVTASDMAEARIVELSAPGGLDGALRLSFEPVLARAEDFEAHPAFWRLGLRAEAREGALLIRRLPRQGLAACWLCLASDAPLEYRADASGEALGWLAHPLVTACARVRTGPGGVFRARFALAFAATEREALDSARRALGCGAGKLADLPSALGALYGADAAARGLPELAARLCFPRVEGGGTARGALWALGVPGDFPIICARVSKDGEDAARAAIARYAILRCCGVRSELVFLTGDGGEYHRDAARAVSRALSAAGLEALYAARAGVYCVGADSEGAVERSAAVVLDARGEPLPPKYAAPAFAGSSFALRRGGRPECEYAPGEFRFTVRGRLPERCWSLPMSNGRFGYIAADCGLGNMWAGNAREERINAWLCDELAASGPETLETESGGGRASLFAAEDGEDCRVSFGLGYAVWEKLGARVTAFVPLDAAARLLMIENPPGAVYWHTTLQLAAEPRDAAFTVTAAAGGLLCARNARSGLEFAAAFSEEASAWSCDEYAWRAGRPGAEAGAGLSPCFGAVLPRAERIVVACGVCGAEELRRLARYENAAVELERVRARYARLCRFSLGSAHPELERYMDGWAVYQTLVCRMAARASVYQSGGAFGFRDQLQDAVNLLPVEPSLARERILDCCAHQYAEGDVMHWWHPGAPDRGVRTRISDDLLWLPWAVCEYIDATGDEGVLAESVRGISSAPLDEGEDSRYEPAGPSGEPQSVLAHAAAALSCALRRGFGPHGLLKMGSGDWCDGFDGVGGESVWLTEFFAHTARRFVKYLDTPSAAALTSAVRRCMRGIEAAWDGEWYRRGYFADGRPLGSRGSEGCKIDAVAQAWAAFALCDAERVKIALKSAVSALHDEKSGLTRLFCPPFGEDTERAGYINGYGPGFRENGGQYTHAAVWLALACHRRGLRAEAESIMLGLLKRGEGYGAEPFVLAADVYSAPERYGRAGWSWYTGSAGWFYRAAREIFGGKR